MMKHFIRLVAIAVFALSWSVTAPATLLADPGDTDRVSVSSSGELADGESADPDINSDGSVVAFTSFATNLVPFDTNAVADIFVHDRPTRQTARISVATNGTEANGPSSTPSINEDARYVAFASEATNLVPRDTNGVTDVFVHDRVTGETTRVSVASDGAQGDDASDSPMISGNGRVVVFRSEASNFSADVHKDHPDEAFSYIYTHNLDTGTTELVSATVDGSPRQFGLDSQPQISNDGRVVAYVCEYCVDAPQFGVYTYVLPTQTTEYVGDVGTLATVGEIALSGNGRFVLYARGAEHHGTVTGGGELWLYDRETGQTERADLAADGTPGNDVNRSPAISDDGRYIAFRSMSTNLIPDQPGGLFIRDRALGLVISSGSMGQAISGVAVNADGRLVAYASTEPDPSGSDTNQTSDIFVHEPDFAPAMIEIADARMARTWARTDDPVAVDVIDRTWMWGPRPFSGLLYEPYAGLPGGVRAVQYFDKARMEITYPEIDPASPWVTTNGLLVVEMITGRMQIGDATFEQRLPADINVAGDPNRYNGPTYAVFGSLRDDPPLAEGAIIDLALASDGTVTTGDRAAVWGVRAGPLIPETGHRVASVFWEFLNSRGTVAVDGEYLVDALFEPWYYASGLPLTEAYWTWVSVDGEYQNVLVQPFERRVLTYTPTNPAGWQVEAGNVGRHYYRWRYTEDATEPTGRIAFVSERDGNPEVYVMDADGSDQRRLTRDPEPDALPTWSPDGSRIAFLSVDDGVENVYVINPDGSDLRRISTIGGSNSWFSWSPDSSQIVYTHLTNDQQYQLYVVNVDGSGTHQLTNDGHLPAWSPDGEWIAFQTYRGGTWPVSSIWLIRPDGGDAHRLVERGSIPLWSPDASRIAFFRPHPPQTDVYIVNVDGSDVRNFTDSPVLNDAAVWSPDSRYLIVQSSEESGLHLRIMAVDGGINMRITGTYLINGLLDWSPDGKWVLYSVFDGPYDDAIGYKIVISTPDGRHTRELGDISRANGGADWTP